MVFTMITCDPLAGVPSISDPIGTTNRSLHIGPEKDTELHLCGVCHEGGNPPEKPGARTRGALSISGLTSESGSKRRSGRTDCRINDR